MNARSFSIGFIAASIMILGASAAPAQTTANGPYYATPAWDQQLPASTRFIVLSNWNSEAVLDRETGLVWERQLTSPGDELRANAFLDCWESTKGGRMGWRLPRVEELLSLTDPSNFANNSPLPPGHPFPTFSGPTRFWTQDAAYNLAGGFAVVRFVFVAVSPPFVQVTVEAQGDLSRAHVWCVRGGAGSSAPPM